VIENIDKFISSSLIEKEIDLNWKSNITSFESRYSYHVKRAIISLVQEFWADDLWGDWRCADSLNCGIIHKNNFLPKGRCIRCGSIAYYEKVLTDDITGFTGSCPAIVYSKEMDGFLVFDINARNSNIITKTAEPYPDEIYKVSAFATLLSRKHCLRIIGRCVLWIGKPKPKPYKFWFYPDIGWDLYDGNGL
jgi:hypothetical protein